MTQQFTHSFFLSHSLPSLFLHSHLSPIPSLHTLLLHTSMHLPRHRIELHLLPRRDRIPIHILKSAPSPLFLSQTPTDSLQTSPRSPSFRQSSSRTSRDSNPTRCPTDCCNNRGCAHSTRPIRPLGSRSPGSEPALDRSDRRLAASRRNLIGRRA